MQRGTIPQYINPPPCPARQGCFLDGAPEPNPFPDVLCQSDQALAERAARAKDQARVNAAEKERQDKLRALAVKGADQAREWGREAQGKAEQVGREVMAAQGQLDEAKREKERLEGEMRELARKEEERKEAERLASPEHKEKLKQERLAAEKEATREKKKIAESLEQSNIKEGLERIKALERELAGASGSGGGGSSDDDSDSDPANKSQGGKDPASLPRQAFHKIKRSMIEIQGDKPIKSGPRSDIWKCEYGCRTMVAKVFKTNRSSGKASADLADKAQEEADRVLAVPAHPNIARYYGLCVDESGDDLYLALVMERATGSLEGFKARDGKEARHILRGVARGLDLLHSREVVHGNLRGSNVLLFSQKESDQLGVKVADMGISLGSQYSLSSVSRSSSNNSLEQCVHLSPEQLRPYNDGKKREITAKADIYSFGMLAWSLAHPETKNPFPTVGNLAFLPEMVWGPEGAPPLRPAWDSNQTLVPKNLVNLITKRCWSLDPSERPSAKELLDALTTE